MKVVIIDDDAVMRRLLRTVLEKDGHEITEAENGLVGLETIHSLLPDLIICDINMPEMSGDELFITLRSDSSLHKIIPFIFMSGDINDIDRINRLNSGADNCFIKPFDCKLLAAHVYSHFLRTQHLSGFIQKQLDSISQSISEKVEHDFNQYQSLIANTQNYVSVIVAAISGKTIAKTTNNGTANSELRYIQFCLSNFEDRRNMVLGANGEDLSWTLIFMVFQAQLEDIKIYVSDLYVSIPSAKSTINARINRLIDERILIKNNDSEDGRRQKIVLTNNFKKDLLKHVSSSISLANSIT